MNQFPLKKRILIACEYSGAVRDQFIALGHDAISCDILPTESPGPHYTGDVRDILEENWDAVIAFPPCTHLCVSGARHFEAKRADGRQQEGIDFFMIFANCAAPMVAIENPIGIMSSLWRKPDQVIQPWQFGHGETKATCLWLKNLPPLTPTKLVDGREPRIWKLGSGHAKERSLTYAGIASAMATQWSIAINHPIPTELPLDFTTL